VPSSGWSAATGARRGSGESTIRRVHTGPPCADDPAVLLELLDLREGHRVLEIGQGELWHTAALTEQVGTQGEVVPISPAGAGTAPGGPFDRLVAWMGLAALPTRWVEHLADKGVASVPLPVAPLAAVDAAVRVDVTPGGQPTVNAVAPGAFLRLPDNMDGVPDRFVDAAMTVGGQPWWVSAEWLHGRHEDDAVDVLALLRDHQRRRPHPLADTEDSGALVGFLLASRPDGMLTAGLGGPFAGVGCALPGSTAVLFGDQLVIGGTDEAAAGLLDWIEEWRSSGRPGLSAFRPYLQRKHTAWELHFERSSEL
jgi:protein-L-isoaspartate(D-aspartate) O-methyltransferase